MHNKEKIWLSSPHMSGEEMKLISETFLENWIAPVGPSVNAFESDISNYLSEFSNSNVYSAVLASGTCALHLALILLDVSPGDVVIVQSLTFCASANPVIYQGADIVFVDSEIDTWNMDPNCLESAINNLIKRGYGIHNQYEPKNGKGYIKAIIPVHLYGMPAKMKEIMQISVLYNIPVIEDAAESLGSKYEGLSCGTFGEMSVLSFNGNKIITTSTGGALISKNSDFIQKARFLSTQARDQAVHYQHSEIGYNYRMSNVLASIGRGQMQVLKDRIAQRRANNQRYRDFLGKIDFVKIHSEPNGNHFSNFWLTSFYLDKSKTDLNIEIIQRAFASENIECRPIWKPMHLQPVYKNKTFFGSGVCEDLFENGLCLPSGSNLTEPQFERIFKVLATVFKM